MLLGYGCVLMSFPSISCCFGLPDLRCLCFCCRISWRVASVGLTFDFVFSSWVCVVGCFLCSVSRSVLGWLGVSLR